MTTTASAASWLSQHIGKDHRLYALDPTHVRCKDCCQTGVLAAVAPDPTDPRSSIQLPQPGTTSPRGKRDLANINDPDACALHPGYWADNCGSCRADTLGRDPDTAPAVPPPTTSARPQDNPEWQAMRATLANRKKTR